MPNLFNKYFLVLISLTLFLTTPNISARGFGKIGEPIRLVVGYQPYYTESWSGVVNNGKQLWKKYLPAGSTVKFQVALQGSVIVKTMA
ncbi:MAG: hypothetical protein IMF12_04815 [Proteobacteria bacterium]|nr:hypothetical protein [Pseudomonadota bacterium]